MDTGLHTGGELGDGERSLRAGVWGTGLRVGDTWHTSRWSQLAASCPAPAADAGASGGPGLIPPAPSPLHNPGLLPSVQARRSPRVPWAGGGHVQGDSRSEAQHPPLLHPAPQARPMGGPGRAALALLAAGALHLAGVGAGKRALILPNAGPRGARGAWGATARAVRASPSPPCLLSPRAPLMLLRCPCASPQMPSPTLSLGRSWRPRPASAGPVAQLGQGNSPARPPHQAERDRDEACGVQNELGAAAWAAEVLLPARGREQDPSHPASTGMLAASQTLFLGHFFPQT